MNEEVTEKENGKNGKHNKGKLLPLILLLPLCSCIGIIWLLTLNDFDTYQSKWDEKHPTAYTAEVWVFVEVSEYPMEIDEDPIAYMFEQAYACEMNFPENLLCSVSYDETYGYPKVVSEGIFEYTSIELRNFHVHEE